MLASKLKHPRFQHFQRKRNFLACRAAATAPTTRVSFKIRYRCKLGEHVCLSGADERLGKWVLQDAAQMYWTQDDDWVLDIEVPDTPRVEMEYKYVVRGTNGDAVAWMEGDNLVLDVPVIQEGGKRAECINVHDAWDQAFQKVSLSVKRDKVDMYTPEVVARNGAPHTGPASDSWMAELLSTSAPASPQKVVRAVGNPVTGERVPADNAELTNRMDAVETEVFGLKAHVRTEMETLREEVKTVTKESVLFVLKRISEVDNSVNELRSQTADALSSIHASIRELNRVSERLSKFEAGAAAVGAQQPQRFERETAVRELARASPRNNGWRR